MASSKNLVDGECGQSNALVRIGRQMFQDGNNQRTRSLLGPLQSRPEDEFTREYLAQFGGRPAPGTFSMHGLLQEVNRMEPGASSAANVHHQDWSREYFRTQPPPNFPPPHEWSAEYLMSRPAAASGGAISMEDAWSTAALDPIHRHHYQPTELKWSAEYLTEAEQRPAIDEEARSSSMLNGIPDDAALWNTEFMQFMQKVDRGEVKIEDDRVTDGGAGASVSAKGDYWDKLESEWDDMANNSESHRWMAEYDSISSMYKNYNMSEENPFVTADDPLSMGKQYLREGDLANAVLCFEASVQRQPESAESWLYLARAQAENEQESRAIAAANKALELEPKNLDALATLATAYANESLYDSSCRSLAQWLAAHPKYESFAPAEIINDRRPMVSSFMEQSIFTTVENAFLDAARSDSSVNADLQNCFGVLYNLTGDTDRAVDCFQTALMIHPEDGRLWNRLGATLANGGRSAEAVAAYRKALELYPGFVRARYNLGISCLNLGANREAIDHFLSALSLQMRGVGPADQRNMSDGIWSTLRVAVMGLRRDDWLNLVDKRDMDGLRGVFGSNNGSSPPPSMSEDSQLDHHLPA